MAQLHKIADAHGPKRANVIFVHGLGGDAHATWRHGPNDETFWPKWLAADLPDLSIYSIGYDAAVSQWSGAAMHLPDAAKNVLERLLVGGDVAEGPLYLMGHSLGGLVIKQMLRTAESEGRHRSDLSSLLARVEKVAFFATPHTGSGQATLGNLLRIIIRPSEATACLIHNDPSLRDLNHWYQDWANSRSIPHLILSETQPTRILRMLVQPNSADPGLAGARPLPIGATHIGICKPPNRTHEVYLHARAFIERMIRPHADPIVTKVGELSDNINKLVAAFGARGGMQKAETGGLEWQTVFDLARRLKPDETLDFDQAIKELENAVTIAIDAIAKGERGTNQDDFVNDVLARVGEKTRTGQFDQAAKEVDAALVELDRREAEQDERTRVSRVTLLEAGVEQDILRRDPQSVARRVEQIVSIEQPDDATARFAALRKRQQAFYVEGDDKGINLSLEIAIEIARQGVVAARGTHQRQGAFNRLGNALRVAGERESGTTRLNEAVEVFREALKEVTREHKSLEWITTHNNLSIVLWRLGERESGTIRLNEAVEAFRETLKEVTREEMPHEWAATQNNLGVTLRTVAERETGTTRLEEAVKAHREALKEFARERWPLDWAMTQNNLGTALWRLGEREDGITRLEEAIQAYREALKEYTRKGTPLDWAAAQNNVGLALWTLGERESGIALFQQAVTAFREALKERTHERAPFLWALTQENVAVVLLSIFRRSGDKETALEAQTAVEEALSIYREGDAEYYVQKAERLRDDIDDALLAPPPPIG